MWSSRRHLSHDDSAAWPLWLVLCALLSVAPLVAGAQRAFYVIGHNRNLAAGNYSLYPDSVSRKLTPAPAGKKPFYISHYGRHGSRYLNSRKGYDIPYSMMRKADSLHALTPIGRRVLNDLKDIIEDSEGRWGDLTGLGKRQHSQIAARMMEHFPEVFEGDAFVDARSTPVNRCVVSMGAAVQQLVRLNPRLQVTMNASMRDFVYLNHQDRELRDSMKSKRANDAYEDYASQRWSNPRLLSLLFVNPDSMRSVITEKWLNYYLLMAGLIQNNTHMGGDKEFLVNLFSYEEIYRFWLNENAWWYTRYGFFGLNGGRQPYMQRYLLRKIIEEADAAIRSNRHGANLRFGHETVVLPLTCLLGINGFDFKTDNLNDLESHGWWACKVFPMAANIQLVFYRSGPQDDDVIFKVLLNEEEATLPLSTDIAPYYHWSDFRAYYLDMLDAYERQYGR